MHLLSVVIGVRLSEPHIDRDISSCMYVVGRLIFTHVCHALVLDICVLNYR